MCCFLSVFQRSNLKSRKASGWRPQRVSRRGRGSPRCPPSQPPERRGDTRVRLPWSGVLTPLRRHHQKANLLLPKTFLSLVVEFEPYFPFFYCILSPSAAEYRNVILSPSDSFHLTQGMLWLLKVPYRFMTVLSRWAKHVPPQLQ